MSNAISGRSVVVEFDGTDLSAYYTDLTWKFSIAKPERIDITSKASGTEEEYETGLLGDNDVSITMKALYVGGDAQSALEGLSEGAEGDLVIYTEGKTNGLPMVTFADCEFVDLSFDGALGSKMGYSAEFAGHTYPAYSTYTAP